MHRLVLTALLATASAGALAETATTTFNVLLTITKACSFSTAASDVNFGPRASSAAAVDADGTLRVTCTKGTPYTVGLSAGAGSGATVSTRKMKSTGGTNPDEVPYNLYRDTNRTLNWGNTPGTDTLGASGTGAEQSIQVNGRLPSANFTADSYSDLITATVTY
jgi:spore coat protein U-like protein